MMEEAVDAPQDFEATASTDLSDQDLSVSSDADLGEDQTGGNEAELDDTDDSTQ